MPPHEVTSLDAERYVQWLAEKPYSLRDEKLALKLTSSLPYLVVYTPPTRDYFCVEPVSHVSNALQMADPAAHGLVALRAGKTHEASMSIEVAAA